MGSLGAANNKSALKSLNITHILTVASSLPPAYPDEFKYKIVAGRKVFDLIHIVFLNISYLFAMVEFDFYLITEFYCKRTVYNTRKRRGVYDLLGSLSLFSTCNLETR